MFSLQDFLRHHWDSNMGGGVHPTKCMGALSKGQKPCWNNSGKHNCLCKPLKVIWVIRNWTLESNKCNWVKEMDGISKYHNSEIIHGWYISIFIYFLKNIVYILTLECNLFFCFIVLRFGAQQRRLLLQMQFDLCLNIINYLLITM